MRQTGPIIQSGKANPGRSIIVKPDPATATTPASLLIVPAKPEDPVGKGTVMEIDGDDDESQVMTITLVGDDPRFNINNFSGPPPAFPFLPGQARSIAQVEWGMAGVQAQAFVDYIHGLSFSIPASWIRITAINAKLPLTDPLTGSNIFGRNIRAGAFCSYGSVGRNGGLSAKLTAVLPAISPVGPPPANQAEVIIPPFASNFIFYPAFSAGIQHSEIRVQDEQGFTIQIIDYPVTSTPSDFTVIELPDNASALVITNLGPGAGVTAGAVIFGIAI